MQEFNWNKVIIPLVWNIQSLNCFANNLQKLVNFDDLRGVFDDEKRVLKVSFFNPPLEALFKSYAAVQADKTLSKKAEEVFRNFVFKDFGSRARDGFYDLFSGFFKNAIFQMYENYSRTSQVGFFEIDLRYIVFAISNAASSIDNDSFNPEILDIIGKISDMNNDEEVIISTDFFDKINQYFGSSMFGVILLIALANNQTIKRYCLQNLSLESFLLFSQEMCEHEYTLRSITQSKKDIFNFQSLSKRQMLFIMNNGIDIGRFFSYFDFICDNFGNYGAPYFVSSNMKRKMSDDVKKTYYTRLIEMIDPNDMNDEKFFYSWFNKIKAAPNSEMLTYLLLWELLSFFRENFGERELKAMVIIHSSGLPEKIVLNTLRFLLELPNMGNESLLN